MTKTVNYGTSIALGMCFGVVLGVITDDLVMGVALGPLFGIILHLLRARRSGAGQGNSGRP